MVQQLDNGVCDPRRTTSITSDSSEPSLAAEVERLTAERDAATTQAANLQKALATSREIGMAVGILMHQRKISGEDALKLLKTVSQGTNRRVSELAAVVVFTGALHPDL